MIRVLLIEPDVLLAATYGEALRKAGLHVTRANSAQNAITAIDRHRPSVIVLELQLAGHNGIEFLHELRSHADLQDIPVILHTLVPKSDLPGTQELLKFQFGVVGYAYKPQTSLIELIKIVQSAVTTESAL